MIKVSNLNIDIDQKNLISHLNISFNKGEFWAILGKNGIGKTTLLHTLSGLINYEIGNILVDNKELKSLNPLNRAQKIALLSQHMETGLDCTVQQTIAYGRYPWSKFKFPNNQEQSIVNKAINQLKLNGLKQKSIQKLSGGELRKVEMATVLAQNTDILLLDEPLNHLDLSFRIELMNLLKKLSHKKTIIMVTHDIQYVQAYCSNVLFIQNNGQVVHGRVTDLMNAANINKMLEINLPKNNFI